MFAVLNAGLVNPIVPPALKWSFTLGFELNKKPSFEFLKSAESFSFVISLSICSLFCAWFDFCCKNENMFVSLRSLNLEFDITSTKSCFAVIGPRSRLKISSMSAFVTFILCPTNGYLNHTYFSSITVILTKRWVILSDLNISS